MYRVKFNKATRTKNKYSAKGTNYNGRWYHSKKEANYAEELDWRIKAGEIKEWKPQHKIDLTVNDVHITNYYMDFRVVMTDGSIQLHEVKGFETAEWQMKWRLLQAVGDLESPGAELILIK